MAEPTTNAAAKKPAPNYSRKTLRALGRKKRAQKLKTDVEYAKAFFEAKSKRATDKKTAYRKKKRGKK